MLKHILSASVIALALIGCQGQNTFKRESNPRKDYTSIIDQSRPYDPAQRAKEEADAARLAQRPCGRPFFLTIEGEQGNLMHFTVGQEKTYTLKVESQLENGQQWGLEVVDGPKDALKPTQVSSRGGVYTFTWTPDDSAVNGQTLVLNYKWAPRKGCESTPTTESIALVVAKDANDTKITFENVPNEVKYAKEQPPITFQVRVTDPTAKKNALPGLAAVASQVENGAVDAASIKDLIDCGQNGVIDGKDVVFTCTLSPLALGNSDELIKAHAGKGDQVELVFSVQAVNKKTKAQSPVTTARLRAQFEKIETARAPQAASNADAGATAGQTGATGTDTKTTDAAKPTPKPRAPVRRGKK